MSARTLRFIMSVQADEVVITFFASIGFIVLYTILAPWWRSPLGRNLVAFDAALSLTLLPSVVHHTFGVNSALSPAFAWFTVGAFAAVPLVIVWRAWILLRVQVGWQDDTEPAGRHAKDGDDKPA